MEDSRLVTNILISLLSNDQKFNTIQQDTGISPRILRKYLDRMKFDGLVKEKTKNWTLGKSKPCTITEKGIIWLIDNSLFDFLKVFSSLFNESSKLEMLKNPKNRDFFKKLRNERYSKTISLARQHFIECGRKGIDPFKELKSLDDLEYKKKFKILDLDEPLFNAFEKLNTLFLFLHSDVSWKEALHITNTHYHIFSPHMRPWLSYRPNSSPKIDSCFLEISNEFKKDISKGSETRC